MTYTDDQRDTARPTPAEAFLLAAHKTRAVHLECALACMVGESLAREPVEPVERSYGA